MVMERRHVEDRRPSCPFLSPFEIGDLEHDRASLKDMEQSQSKPESLYVESHG